MQLVSMMDFVNKCFFLVLASFCRRSWLQILVPPPKRPGKEYNLPVEQDIPWDGQLHTGQGVHTLPAALLAGKTVLSTDFESSSRSGQTVSLPGAAIPLRRHPVLPLCPPRYTDLNMSLNCWCRLLPFLLLASVCLKPPQTS